MTDDNRDSDPSHGVEASPRQPMFNAPWPAVMAAAVILGGYALQGLLPDGGQAYALYPVDVTDGRPLGLVTSMFLHGGWTHAGMNAAFALAFGAPVARLLGLQASGVLAFLIFYLLCGVAGGLTFVALHPASVDALVGASGAVSGLMGGAARLMETPGRLGSPFSRPALSMAAAWVIVNLLIAVTGFAPGAEGASVAWEAHLGGFAAGLLLIGPFARVLKR